MATPLVLPQGIELIFLTEGAANVVYRMDLSRAIHRPLSPVTKVDLDADPGAGPDSTTPPPSSISPIAEDEDVLASYSGHLLRLHKQVDWIPSAEALQDAQSRLIAPLFHSSELVEQRLVLVPQNILLSLNDTLLRESKRKANRKNMPLALDEPYGLLVTDMSADPNEQQVLIEVKPKWLAKSPNEPQSAKRCRTCALRCKRLHEAPESAAHGQDAHAIGFCPLDLVNSDDRSVQRITSYIVTHSSQTKLLNLSQKNIVKQKLQHFLSHSNLLVRLRDAQLAKDKRGVLSYETTVDTDFLVATTLRDCTLFLRLTTLDDGGTVEARLGDLDLKSPEPSKLEHWRATERALIQDGWYEGRLPLEDAPYEAVCLLERSSD